MLLTHNPVKYHQWEIHDPQKVIIFPIGDIFYLVSDVFYSNHSIFRWSSSTFVFRASPLASRAAWGIRGGGQLQRQAVLEAEEHRGQDGPLDLLQRPAVADQRRAGWWKRSGRLYHRKRSDGLLEATEDQAEGFSLSARWRSFHACQSTSICICHHVSGSPICIPALLVYTCRMIVVQPRGKVIPVLLPARRIGPFSFI